jgi:hypothetical protein
VGPRAGLDGRGKSRPHRDPIPVPPSRAFAVSLLYNPRKSQSLSTGMQEVGQEIGLRSFIITTSSLQLSQNINYLD